MAVKFFWGGTVFNHWSFRPFLSLRCHLSILHLIRSCEFVLSVGSWKVRRCETQECCYESAGSDECKTVVRQREFGLNQVERNRSGNTFVTILSSCVSVLIVAAAASVEITSWAPGTHPVNHPPWASDDDDTPPPCLRDSHQAPCNCLKAPKTHVMVSVSEMKIHLSRLQQKNESRPSNKPWSSNSIWSGSMYSLFSARTSGAFHLRRRIFSYTFPFWGVELSLLNTQHMVMWL